MSETICVTVGQRIKIIYCRKCKWLTRAAWMAQELLSTFEDELEEVSLVPTLEAGTFQVKLGEYIIWDRKKFHGFPQPAELKQRVRNILCPAKDLGHIDED